MPSFKSCYISRSCFPANPPSATQRSIVMAPQYGLKHLGTEATKMDDGREDFLRQTRARMAK